MKKKTTDLSQPHAAASPAPLCIPDGWEMVPADGDFSAWVAVGEGDAGFDDFIPGVRLFEPDTDYHMHPVAFCEFAGSWPYLPSEFERADAYGVTWCYIRRVEPERRGDPR